MDNKETDILFKRVVSPGLLQHIDRANRMGIRLKSTSSYRSRPPSRNQSAQSTLASRAKTSPHRIGTPQGEPQYIQDVVVPISTSEEDSRAVSHTPRVLSVKEYEKSVASLPYMRTKSGRSSAKTARSLSLYSEKYLSSTPIEHLVLQQCDSPRWNRSNQALRYENEQHHMAKCKLLKRTSEIRPHRVDRMYYMSGSRMVMKEKYDVNDEELQRLKDLTRARRDSQHYGRGLRSRHERYSAQRAYEESPPLQPPPSERLGGPGHVSIGLDDTQTLHIYGQEAESQLMTDSQEAQEDTTAGKDTGGEQDAEMQSKPDTTSMTVNQDQKDIDSEHNLDDHPLANAELTDLRDKFNVHDSEATAGGSTTSHSDWVNSQILAAEVEGLEVGSAGGATATEDKKAKESDEHQDTNSQGNEEVTEKDVKLEYAEGESAEALISQNLESGTLPRESEQQELSIGQVSGAEHHDPGAEYHGSIAEHHDSNAEHHGSVAELHGSVVGHHDSGADHHDSGASNQEGVSGEGDMTGVGASSTEARLKSVENEEVRRDLEEESAIEDSVTDPGTQVTHDTERQEEDISSDQSHSSPGVSHPRNDKEQSGDDVQLRQDSLGGQSEATSEKKKIKPIHVKRDGFKPAKDSALRVSFSDNQGERQQKRLVTWDDLDQQVDVNLEWDNENFCEVLSGGEDTEEREKKRMIFRSKTQYLEPVLQDSPETRGDVKVPEAYTFITPQQQVNLGKKFQQLDVSGRGYVTRKELHASMFEGATEQDLQYFMRIFDLNKDCTVDEREFVTVAALNDKLSGKKYTSADEPLELNLPKLAYYVTAYREMFDLLDENRDGFLNTKELMLLVSAAMGIDVGTNKDLINHVMKVVDRDSSGHIDFVEYLTYIPFFLHLHQQLLQKPVLIEDIEKARQAVRLSLRSTHKYVPLHKKTANIWDENNDD